MLFAKDVDISSMLKKVFPVFGFNFSINDNFKVNNINCLWAELFLDLFDRLWKDRRVVHRVTASDSEWNDEWQQMTMRYI